MLIQFINVTRNNFRRPNSSIVQVILIQLLIWMILTLVKVICFLLGFEGIYEQIYLKCILPSQWSIFLTQPWSILTYFWIQPDLWSMLWDSFFLYLFGKFILSNWRHNLLFVFYIGGGILAGFAFLTIYNLAPGLQNYSATLVGPSGSLYAILFAPIIALPNTYFNLFLFFPIKNKHLALILLLLAFVELASQNPTGIARLGGALASYLIIKWLQHDPKFQQITNYFSARSRKKIKFKITYPRKQKLDQ